MEDIRLSYISFISNFPFPFLGISLRKVEKSEQKEIERNTAMLDVASILARRVAIELSESDDSDSEDDSEGWIETNETSAWSLMASVKPDKSAKNKKKK